MSIETIILRFRDLSTNVGETIKLHRAKITTHKYAWWGWWHKNGETIPHETFQSLMSIIKKNGHLDVFLFDTGTATVYPARISEIRWNPLFQEIDSPSWKATPPYYKGRKFKAWYKIIAIRDGIKDASVLRKWSYVEVSELFETKLSIFQDFDGKQISSFEELRHQERTIWFIRTFRAKDEVREILLYDTGRVKPSSFPANVVESRSARLLWLSDLHFSEDHHEFPLKKAPQKGNKLAEAIRKDQGRGLRIGDADDGHFHASDLEDLKILHTRQVIVPMLQVRRHVLELGEVDHLLEMIDPLIEVVVAECIDVEPHQVH